MIRYSRDQQGQVRTTAPSTASSSDHVAGPRANNTLHVTDNDARVATVRVGDAFPGDGAPDVSVRYQLGDHLGGAHVVLGGQTLRDGAFVDREEYTPYGETSFGSFARKRYRFAGRERDEDSGLYQYGARHYAPWTARWASPDPDALVVEKPKGAPRPPVSGYQYAAANPLAFLDRDGNKPRSFYVTLPADLFRDQDSGGYLTNSGRYGQQLADTKDSGFEHITASGVDDLVASSTAGWSPATRCRT